MTPAEFRADLELRAADAERLATSLRRMAAELAAPASNGNGHPPTSLPAGDRWLTAREVAARLGCSPRYVYANADDFPFTRRAGALVRFSATGLEHWLARRPLPLPFHWYQWYLWYIPERGRVPCMPPKPADPLVQFKLRIPASLRRALKVHAAQSGTPMQQIVTDALTALLKRKGAL